MANVITLTINAETGAVTSALKDFDKAVKQTSDSTTAFNKASKMAFQALATAIAGMKIALIAGIKSAVEYGIELDRITKTTGLSVQTAAKLKYAIEQEHGSIQNLNTAMPILAKNIEAARYGSKDAEMAFIKMGVSIYDASGKVKTVDQVLVDMSDYMRGGATDTEKLALAQQLLGRSGSEMIPFLKLGKDEIQRLGTEAEKLGLVMSDKDVKAFHELDGAITAARGGLKGMFLSIAKELMPEMKDWTKIITDLGPKISEAIRTGIKAIKSLGAILGAEFLTISSYLDWLWERVKWLFDNIVSYAKSSMDYIKSGFGNFGTWLGDWAEFAKSKLTFWKDEDIQPPPLSEIWGAEFEGMWKPFEPEGLAERLTIVRETLNEQLEEIWTEVEEKAKEGGEKAGKAFRKGGQESTEQILIDWKKVSDQLKASITEYSTFVGSSMIKLADGMSTAFADTLVEGKNFGETMKALFKDLMKSIIAYIAKVIILKSLLGAIGFEGGGIVPGFKSGGIIPKFQAGGEVPILAHVGEYIIPADMVKQIKAQRELPLGLLSGIISGTPPRFQAGGMVNPSVSMGDTIINIASLPAEPTEAFLDRLTEAVRRGQTSAVTFSKYAYNTGMKLAGEVA